MLAAERIREQVERSGIKNNYIAERTGITNNRISRILTGKGRMTAEEFLKIVPVVNMDLDAFKDLASRQSRKTIIRGEGVRS